MPCWQATEASISKAREVYRPVAMRGSLVYFLISSLSSLDRVYHYSMANFVRIMVKAMVRRCAIRRVLKKNCCLTATGWSVRPRTRLHAGLWPFGCRT